MPPGYQIKRYVDGEWKLTMGSGGEYPECKAMSQEMAEKKLQEMLDEYISRGIDVKWEEYTIEALGDVPYVEDFPIPDPLPSCYRK